MDTLRNKRYVTVDYLARTTGVPYYFDTLENRDIMGLGSNLKKDTPWVAHIVKQEDTFDSLALKYYNNPTYWWIIAYFNDEDDPLTTLSTRFKIIKIPNMNSIEFGDERN